MRILCKQIALLLCKFEPVDPSRTNFSIFIQLFDLSIVVFWDNGMFLFSLGKKVVQINDKIISCRSRGVVEPQVSAISFLNGFRAISRPFSTLVHTFFIFHNFRMIISRLCDLKRLEPMPKHKNKKLHERKWRKKCHKMIEITELLCVVDLLFVIWSCWMQCIMMNNQQQNSKSFLRGRKLTIGKYVKLLL